MMKSAPNTLFFYEEYHVHDNRRLFQELENLIDNRGYSSINLDFGETTVCFAEAMVPMVSLLRKYHIDDLIRFDLILPRNSRLNRLFINCDWAHFICPQKYKKTSADVKGNMSLRCFSNETEQTAAVNQLLDCTLKLTADLDRSHLAALEWALNEIIDNAIRHSKSSLGGMVQLSIHPTSHEIEFIVSDSGIGIPLSLRKNKKYEFEKDQILLEEAIKEGVKGGDGDGQGNGLFGSFQISLLSGGTFSINSGEAFLAKDKTGAVISRTQQPNWPGTSVKACLKYENPLLLEKSLTIGGRAFEPTDMLEVLLSNSEDGKTISFILQKEVTSTGSRSEGLKLRNKINNYIKMSEFSHFVIDFTGCGVLSSSFADELFAKFYIEHGEQKFGRTFTLENAQPINLRLIERSIRQRVLSAGQQ